MVVKKKNMFSGYAKKRLKTFFVILAIAVLTFNVFSTFLVGIASAQENGGQNCDTSKYLFDVGAKYITNCSLGRFTRNASTPTTYTSDIKPLEYEIVLDKKADGKKDVKNAKLNKYELFTLAGGDPNCVPTSYTICDTSAARTARKDPAVITPTNITISKDVADDNAAGLPVYQYDNELVNGKNVKKNAVVNPDHTLVLRLDGGEYKADTTTAVQSGSKYTVKVSDSDDNRGALTTITCTVGASNGSGYGNGETTCSDPHTEDIIIKDDNDPKTPLDITAAASGSGSSQENQTLTDQCASALPSLGWILCGVIDIADSLYGTVRSWVYKLLYIPESNYNSTDCTEGCLKDTWNVSKNLANVGIVLVALIMISSQIFSFEFMSAYTIKKVIPRLIAAAILIQLSWFIFGAMIQITNALGFGIYSLLTNAFGATDIMGFLGSDTVMEGATKQVAGGAILAGIIGGGLALGVSIMSGGAALTIVFAMLGVIISLAMAVITLLVRKMLIIILLAIAPLALLAWILPGTQNLWNAWWKLFSRLLAMMPLIALLFAAGTIGAKVILTSEGDQLFSFIAGIIVFFAPLFLITATFKFAGGMFNSVQNIMNKGTDKTKGFGWFGQKDRAKFNKENSDWARAKKDKESDRLNQSNNDYASTLAKGNWYSRRLKGRSGVTEAGRNRAVMRATAARSAEQNQLLKDAQTQASFEIEMIRGEGQADGTYRRTDSSGNVVTYKDKKQANAAAEARFLKAASGAEFDENGLATIKVDGRSMQVSRETVAYVARNALATKNPDEGNYNEQNINEGTGNAVFDYVHSTAGSRALVNLGQADDDVRGVLLKHAPAVGKGITGDVSKLTPNDSIITRSDQTGYDLAINGYANIGNTGERIKIRDALVKDLQSGDAAKSNKALADLTHLVRRGDLEVKHIKEFEAVLGTNISLLKADEQAVAEVKPDSTSPSGVRIDIKP